MRPWAAAACGVLALALAGNAVASEPIDAPAAGDGSGFAAKGYLIARYAYVGSSSPSTVGSTLRLTGSLRISSASSRVALQYRSHHWFSFKHTAKHALESAFKDRNIVQTVALETDGLLRRGLLTRLGRFFPEMDYAAAPAVDGAEVALRARALSVRAAVGRIVDLWNGEHTGSSLMAAGQLGLETGQVRAAAGFVSASYPGVKKREAPAGFSVKATKHVWVDGYGAYDFEFGAIARAGASLSWHEGTGSLSIAASLWRNQFDQLYLQDKEQDLPYWGLHSRPVPATYRDLRLAGSFSHQGWGIRASFGSSGGVRSGWTAGGYVTAPSFARLTTGVGAQIVESDFADLASLDARITYRLGRATLAVESELRSFTWPGGASIGRDTDARVEVSAEYPVARQISVSAAAGGLFRRPGNEGFQPRAELRLIARP